jgi:hypothetical protein
MKKLFSVLLIICLALTLLPVTALAADKTLTLTEDWRLTSDFDLNVGAGDVLTIDGTNTHYIYEMGGVLKNTGAGLVVLKNTVLYPAGGTPASGSIAALIAAAAGVTSITAPAKDATSLSIPTVSGFVVTIKSSGNTGVIALNGTVTPPASAATVNLVLTLTGNGGMADTSSISVTVPARTLSITTATLPAATIGSAYSQTISKNYTGGGTVTFSATGLPGGLSINAGTGLISGTPASGADAGSPYSVAVTATDGTYSDTKTYSLTVSPAYSGGGAGGGTQTTYNADVTGGGSVPVNVNTAGDNASLDLSTLSGNLSGGVNTVVTAPSIPGVKAYTASIPSSAISGSGTGSLTLNTDNGSITIPGNMLSGTNLTGKAGITIGEVSKENLPDDVKAAIGNRPVIQLTLTLDGQQTAWNNPNAPVTVSIPYTPTAAELANPEGIVIWYIDGSGNVVTIPNGHYDPATGTVTFETTHFSNYAVGYNKVSFSDVAVGAWYNKAVSFIAARGITTGTGGGNFSPDAKLTRGQFIVMLMKAYDIVPATNPADNFADAGNTYYTNYLAAAKTLGISNGVGNNMFAPEKEITREEMFTLLYNALKVIGQLPQGSSGKTLSDFTDAGQIDSWATEAMTLLIKTGTVSGNDGALNPTSTTTRAEMAQVLYNLLSK